MKYSERTYKAIQLRAVEDVLDWFIFSDKPAPRNWMLADPWKSAVEALEERIKK